MESKRVKEYANKFFRKVDDERSAVRMAFNQWMVDSGEWNAPDFPTASSSVVVADSLGPYTGFRYLGS